MSLTFSERLWSASLILAVSVAAVRATPALKVSISGPPTAEGVDDFFCLANIKNTGDEDLDLYNEPRGLLNPIGTQSFKVAKSNGNGDASFNGIIAKYSFNLATSFTKLKPGEEVAVRHDLSNAYTFDSTGAYDIAPAELRFFYKDATTGAATPLIATLATPTHTVKLSGSLKSRHIERRQRRANQLAARSLEKRGIQIENCSGSSLNDAIALSAQVASLYIADAEKYLSTVTGASERYTTWFGDFDQTLHDTVLNHYSIIRASDVKTYTFDCTCTESSDVFAYVSPDEFGHIHLCNQYIAADVAGTDSKAGTIVHESSHFTRNAGTKDIAYGKTKCQSLAITNATAAVGNADSHEYFAENNSPSLA